MLTFHRLIIAAVQKMFLSILVNIAEKFEGEKKTSVGDIPVWNSVLDSLNILSCVDLPSESFRLIRLFQRNTYSPSAPKAKLQLSSIGLYPLDHFLWKETLQKLPLGIWITTCYYTVFKFLF